MRHSPPSVRLSPQQARALFVSELKAHSDYCRLQQQRLALLESERNETLALRLAGAITPFERACAQLYERPAKRLKGLEAEACACARSHAWHGHSHTLTHWHTGTVHTSTAVSEAASRPHS